MACTYTITIDNKEFTFDTLKEAADYIRKNQLYAELSKKTLEPAQPLTTQILVDNLRQMEFGELNYDPFEFKTYQEELLDQFIQLEDQSRFYYSANAAIALTKGPGKSMEQIDRIKMTLGELGIESEYDPKIIPFDVRYLLTGNGKYKPTNADAYHHKLTANNLRILNQIDSLSKLIFIDRTRTFMSITDKVIGNLKSSVATDIDKSKDIKDEFSSFVQIAAYKKWIAINDRKTTTLRNSLIYDSGNEATIVDIAREAIKLAPENGFLKFILPVSTVVKSAKKQTRNIINRDLINTIEGKTRGNLEPDVISSVMDSFTELYQNPKTTFHAKALFDYLIVKDGLMFKNKSFIKMIPTFMFRDISDATTIANKLFAAYTTEEYKRLLGDLNKQVIVDREGKEIEYFTDAERVEFRELLKDKNLVAVRDKLFTKVFGYGYNPLYNRFENIYATDIRNQFNLDLVRAKGTSTIFMQRDNNNDIFAHITYFTDEYNKTEGEKKKEVKKKLIEDLDKAGISVSPYDEADGKSFTDFTFKKFIKMQNIAGEYHLYQLHSIRRGKNVITDPNEFILPNELTPRGNYAVYKRVEPVGTSNSIGVADLGKRPTREIIQKNIQSKLAKQPKAPTPPKKDDGDAAAPTAPVTPPTTPTPVISGGIFGGLEQLPFDPNDIDMGGFGIDEDDINNALNDLDKC